MTLEKINVEREFPINKEIYEKKVYKTVKDRTGNDVEILDERKTQRYTKEQIMTQAEFWGNLKKEIEYLEKK